MVRFVAVLGFGTALLLGPTVALAAPAAENYRLYCVQCHGTSGNGQGINADGLSVSPRDHTSAVEMTKLTDEDLRLAIAKGGEAVRKSELMPPWGAVLSAEEIDELVAYTRKLCKCTAAK
jgi:mono/diheme cytochrome c family protein